LFRFQQIILVDEFNLISRQTNLNNEAIERKTLKTNFERKTIEIFKRKNKFYSTSIITEKTKKLELKV